jgi:hypothetical protein
MNEPDDSLRARYQRQRARDESRAPSFHAMSARARTHAASPRSASRPHWLLWLAPATAAVVLAAFFLRPQPTPAHDYSDRIAALISELDAPPFAQNTVPSDLLPAAFPPP